MLADPGEKCLPAAVRMPLELMMDTSIPDATPGPESTPPGATPPEATPARAAADVEGVAGAAFRALAALELSTVFCVYVALLVLALLLEPWSTLFPEAMAGEYLRRMEWATVAATLSFGAPPAGRLPPPLPPANSASI